MAAKIRRQISSDYKLLCGTCPDDQCKARLFFPGYQKSIECSQCGQRHEQSLLQNVAEVTNPSVALHNLLKNVLLGTSKPKKGADNVKVSGLSNYVCKLISPVLTEYGMDKKAGCAQRLEAMGQGDVLDCGRILCERAFLIEEENLDVIGYGRDRSGSLVYLEDILNDIKKYNDDQSWLVPIHTDGDGHCLVHAISRALVGRELFWHALRVNLGRHIKNNIDRYKLLLGDFVDKDEWHLIIDECDPYYIPPEGEPLGLRNIHIFGLTNVLKRPIILLDSAKGMSSFGDYSGVFLPGLVEPDECRGKDGTLNKPLCIAWSSLGRNHYIPLVGVKGKPLPKLPRSMLQKAWGMNREEIKKYVDFDSNQQCIVGGDKCLSDKYLRHLVEAMEKVFLEQHGVHPTLVGDVHQYIYRSTGVVGVLPDEVIQRTQYAVQEDILYRCLTCEALVEYRLSPDLFQSTGSLYKLAKDIHKELRPDKIYSFPTQGTVCTYDKEKDCLVPDMSKSHPSTCAFCAGELMRKVCGDGSIQYNNGDRTTNPSASSLCPCGFKHYWDGKEYDNLPSLFPIRLQWTGQLVEETVAWFQDDTDPSLNSNVYEVAQSVVQKHFPGEFGSERLVQQVVDTILTQTAAANKRKEPDTKTEPADIAVEQQTDGWSAETASKIILTGPKHKTLHKEELNKSEKEKMVLEKIQTNAAKQQQRKSGGVQQSSATTTPGKKKVTTTSSVTKMSNPAVSTSQARSISSPTPSTSTQPDKVTGQSLSRQRKVKLATSDGRQVMMTLVKDVTYTDLQKMIYQAVDIPANQQRIRLGFPPKVLQPPRGEEDTEIIPLSHGDKVTLEILDNIPKPSPATIDDISEVPSVDRRKLLPSPRPDTWKTFEESASSRSAENLLQALKQTHSGGDSIDTSIASLAIMSAIGGKDLWTYVQSMPHLFSVGGLLYKQVQRDLGLVDGKHCQLPSLPGKVFRYTKKGDRLELCLEPFGHFPVEPDIEQKVKEGIMLPGHDGPVFRFGTSGSVHHSSEHQAFQGQGHSMRVSSVNERMPQDLTCAGPKPQARGFHDFCSVGNKQQSIEEEPDEGMQIDPQDRGQSLSAEDQADAGEYHRRLGPGYSVVDPEATNAHNANVEMFRALARSIQETLTEEMEEDSDSKDDSLSARVSTSATPQNQTTGSVAMETRVVLPTDDKSQRDHRDVTVGMDTDDVQVSAKSVDSVETATSVGGVTSESVMQDKVTMETKRDYTERARSPKYLGQVESGSSNVTSCDSKTDLLKRELGTAEIGQRGVAENKAVSENTTVSDKKAVWDIDVALQSCDKSLSDIEEAVAKLPGVQKANKTVDEDGD